MALVCQLETLMVEAGGERNARKPTFPIHTCVVRTNRVA